MHILTKILAVLAAGLSLGLAALTSSYALNAEKIVREYNDKVAEANQARANADLQSSQFAAERAALEAQLRERDIQIVDLSRGQKDLETAAQSAQIAARSAQDDAARVQRQIGDLGKTAESQQVFIESLTGEVRTLRDENLRSKNESIDLLARIADLENSNDVLTQTNRALQVTIADLQEQLDTTTPTTTVAGGAQIGAPGQIPGPAIRGAVQAVRKINDQILAEIDLGERDRVKTNTKMFIIRDGRWLADLVITQTDIQSSVGRVDALGRTGIEIREGDTVLSSLGG